MRAKESQKKKEERWNEWLENVRPRMPMPCNFLNYCPYGPLVESSEAKNEEEWDENSCNVFGHQCPVYDYAEPVNHYKSHKEALKQREKFIKFMMKRR